MKVIYTDKGATISPCGRYRYTLFREWAADKGTCLFIMLNPSTADGLHDDRTIGRCVDFAVRLGFGRLEVVNLFAFRATDPDEMKAFSKDNDPVGPENYNHILGRASEAKMVICGWGTNGVHLNQNRRLLGWLKENGIQPYALALSKDGHPRHPLYLAADSEPFPYFGEGASA